MNLYEVELTEAGTNVCFSRHVGVASSITNAMALALEYWEKDEQPPLEEVTLEVRSVRLLGECDFTEA